MTETRIDSSVESDLSSAITDYSVGAQQTDGPTDQKETTWINSNWSQQLGYYNEIPELGAVIDAKARWTVGKGFQADEITTMLLDTIKGFGVDTFNTILENLKRTMEIGGDSFAEIIRDEEENLINVKPLDPGVMKIIVDRRGLIIRYEQTSKNKNNPKKFTPEQIFHLPRNRVADQIHGTSMIKNLEWIIKAKNEIQAIVKQLMQRHLKPVMIFHLDTDDPTEIASFKAKMDKAYADGENMYIPKDVVVPEVLSIAPNATLNPLPWLEWLNDQFYLASGVPKIILGGTGAITEAAVKIAYLAFEQTIREDQLYIEEQVLSQLNLIIKLEIPASLQNEMLSDEKKDGAESEAPQAIKPSETTAGEGQ